MATPNSRHFSVARFSCNIDAQTVTAQYCRGHGFEAVQA